MLFVKIVRLWLLGLLFAGKAYAQLEPLFFACKDASGLNKSLCLMGGLGNPQFSNFSSTTGQKYLFLFDRTDKQIFFLQKINHEWNVETKLKSAFPDVSEADWVLLKDYDGDSLEDVFLGVRTGIIVYKRTADTLYYLEKNPILSRYYGDLQPLYSASIDIPAIQDIDQDGDLDLLVFDVTGVYVEWHKNLSQERFGHTDSLMYVLEKTCWGDFIENYQGINADIDLNAGCERIATKTSHTGGSLFVLNQPTPEGIRTLYSDIGFKNIVGLFQTKDSSKVIQKDLFFPSKNVPVNINDFPAVFEIKLKGNSYFVFSPQSVGCVDDVNATWLYNSQFERIDTAFIEQEMLDFGTDVSLSFDENGTLWFKAHRRKGQYQTPFWAFRLKPEPALIDSLYHPKFDKIVGFVWLTPNESMIYTTLQGEVMMTKRNGQHWTQQLVLSSKQTQNRRALHPALFDIDKDGDLDLFLGTDRGFIQFFEQIGSVENPSFILKSETWANIQTTDSLNNFLGFSTIAFGSVKQNHFVLVNGASGFLRLYRLEGQTPIFIKTLNAHSIGTQAKIAILPDDNSLLIFIGTQRGGIMAYRYTPENILSERVEKNNTKSFFFPNPVRVGEPLSYVPNFISNYSVYDWSGQLIYTSENQTIIKDLVINKAGIFLIYFYNNNKFFSQKIIVINK